MMPTSRRTNHQAFRLTGTKRRTLEILAEYFCLRTRDVAHLLRNREPNQNALRSSRRTLELLFKQGLTHRIPYIEPDRDAGGITYVHGLSDKGTRIAEGKTFDDHSIRTLDHELEISFFHIALKQIPLKLYWQQSDLKRGIHPDALFALTNEKGTFYFFLEIEKSGLGKYINGEPGIIRKLLKYAEYYDTDQCAEDWNFRKFRTVIVQTNDTRRQNLLEALGENEKLARRMFWLTTGPLYKESIGGEIFCTPTDPETGRYSFLLL
jgi:hypothetical protein